MDSVTYTKVSEFRFAHMVQWSDVIGSAATTGSGVEFETRDDGEVSSSISGRLDHGASIKQSSSLMLVDLEFLEQASSDCPEDRDRSPPGSGSARAIMPPARLSCPPAVPKPINHQREGPRPRGLPGPRPGARA